MWHSGRATRICYSCERDLHNRRPNKRQIPDTSTCCDYEVPPVKGLNDSLALARRPEEGTSAKAPDGHDSSESPSPDGTDGVYETL